MATGSLQLWKSELRRVVELIEVVSGTTVVPNVQDAVIPELISGIRVAIGTNVVDTAIANFKGKGKGKGKADRSEPYGGKGKGAGSGTDKGKGKDADSDADEDV